jgi:hypothetical protein
MTLPDKTFFELMRSILGAVKTPFNKQTLLEELSLFVANPGIQEIIAAYIDDNDRRIIAAVALLGEPLPKELECIFRGEFSYAELQGMILNLEERLILYRFRDEGKLHLALNPRLEKILGPAAGDGSILFPSVPVPRGITLPPPSMDDRILAALCAFLSGKEILKGEEAGELSIRKKILEEGARLFPDLDIEGITGGCISLGLFNLRGEWLEWDGAKLEAFKALSSRHRFEYLAAGITLFLRPGAVYPGRGRLRNTARLIHALVNRTEETGRLFPETTLIKFLEVLRREEEQSWGFAGELPPSSLILHSMVMAGLLIPLKPGAGVLYLSPRFKEAAAEEPAEEPAEGPAEEPAEGPAEGPAETADIKAPGPRMVMDSGFSCILYPEVSFGDAIDLAAFSDLEEMGTTVRFVLSRESVVRGFDRAYTADRMWELLERLSGNRVEDTLKWTLTDWEKRYREVSLVQGLVLTLEGGRSYLAQTGPIASMIKRTLAPGVYLLSGDAEEAVAALNGAGVDIVARPGRETAGGPGSFPSLESPAEAPPKTAPEAAAAPGAAAPGAAAGPEAAAPGAAAPEEKAERIKAQFRALLREIKLSGQELEEMEGRIERKVVVSEKQLRDPSLRYEKLEARSLDYVGKAGIARQAIVSREVLELTWTIPGNGEQKLLGVPENLEKKGGEMILTVQPREGGEPLKIPLGKISLLRRIKQSIFGE